jgi:hypothetical protein
MDTKYKNDKPPHPLCVLIAAPLALICGIISKFNKNNKHGREKTKTSNS